MLTKDVKQRYANGGSLEDAGVGVISAGIVSFAFAHPRNMCFPSRQIYFEFLN